MLKSLRALRKICVDAKTEGECLRICLGAGNEKHLREGFPNLCYLLFGIFKLLCQAVFTSANFALCQTDMGACCFANRIPLYSPFLIKVSRNISSTLERAKRNIENDLDGLKYLRHKIVSFHDRLNTCFGGVC